MVKISEKPGTMSYWKEIGNQNIYPIIFIIIFIHVNNTYKV